MKAKKILRPTRVASNDGLGDLFDDSSVATLRKYTLIKGFIIKIDGIPFMLEEKAIISGNKRNFELAGLYRGSKNVG